VATDLWRALGISDVIKNALVVDTAILKFLMSRKEQKFPNSDMGLAEMTTVACWYL
jgi:hypothetical protein